jgi:DNA-directed RNA polymerase subunit RPC12/RpoP
VYAGHAAVALALKTRDPRVPIVPLTLACYGPDWLETVLGFWRGRYEMALYTHYLPGLFAGGLAAAALYAVVFRRPGGWLILSGWLLHWPADFFTAHKGLLSPTDRVGLDLYNLPAADFILEAALVLACCALYARTFAHSPAQRRWAMAMAAALLALQGMLDYGFGASPTSWNPSLTQSDWRSQPGFRSLGLSRIVSPHASCTLACHLHSERAMAKNGVRGVTTLVCLTCGKEKFFTQEVPAAVACDQCGSTVFRNFDTPTEPDEAVIDALEVQARSMAYGDSSPDTTPGDLHDLDAS